MIYYLFTIIFLLITNAITLHLYIKTKKDIDKLLDDIAKNIIKIHDVW